MTAPSLAARPFGIGVLLSRTCWWCHQPVTECTAPACIAAGLTHVASRKHACANGLTCAYTRGGAR